MMRQAHKCFYIIPAQNRNTRDCHSIIPIIPIICQQHIENKMSDKWNIIFPSFYAPHQ